MLQGEGVRPTETATGRGRARTAMAFSLDLPTSLFVSYVNWAWTPSQDERTNCRRRCWPLVILTTSFNCQGCDSTVMHLHPVYPPCEVSPDKVKLPLFANPQSSRYSLVEILNKLATCPLALFSFDQLVRL